MHNQTIAFETFSEDELCRFLENIHEKYWIELKKSSDLPAAFWESYSSFSNTSGGFIILGVREGSPYNEIIGVDNPEKTTASLWDQVSNANKVNFRNIDNRDVNTYTVNGKKVIIVYVKEAAENMKPVYTNGKLENVWIRTGDGDRKATKEELAAFMRNAQPGQDMLVADGFTLDDLDTDSVITFKERVSKRFPQKNYIEMSAEAFLTEIGGCVQDRISGEVRIKRGTLLFLGKVNSIKEMFPHYHVDFFNRRGNNPRWVDRVSDDEPGEYEMNLYNFYRIVYEKLRILLQDSFVLDAGQMRLPSSDFDEIIRECMVNCLAHADYTLGFPTTKIDVYDGWFSFTNPGKMLVSARQFIAGGDSRPRNEIIMKFFRLLGASERQGFGGPLIYKTAMNNDYRRPEIVTDLEHTEIKVWNIDLADSYPGLSPEEKVILRFVTKAHSAQPVSAIKKATGMTDYSVRNAIQALEAQQLLCKIGNGPSTRYDVVEKSLEFLTQFQIIMDKLKAQIH